MSLEVSSSVYNSYPYGFMWQINSQKLKVYQNPPPYIWSDHWL